MVDLSNLGALQELANRSYAPVELNIGDEWRALWMEDEPLPKDIPVNYLYAAVIMDDRGYLVRPRGSEQWDSLEGRVAAGTKPEAALKAIAKDQAAATPAAIRLVGWLNCKATSHNPEFDVGARTARPFYLFAAKQVKDLGPTSPFERRRLPMNEYMMALRNRYPVLDQYFGKTTERYLIMRAEGEI